MSKASKIPNILSYGNKKLPKSTMIFNMGSALSCPSDKLELCEVSDECYAKKAENIYPQVLPYRNRQRDFWLKNDAHTIATFMLSQIIRKRIKITELRLNEAGDFYSQACVTKADKVAEILKKSADVNTYIYTARRDLDFSKVKHMVINGSGFKKEGITRSFTAVKEIPENGFECIQDCTQCNKCSLRDSEDVFVTFH